MTSHEDRAELGASGRAAPDVGSSSGTSLTSGASDTGLPQVADTMRADSDSNPEGRSRLSSPELLEGDVLDNAYRVIRRIGGGAMGTVYLVEHTHLGRRFAAKVVASAHCTDAQVVARLRNEARVASSIQHENLVDVTHLGQTAEGALFIVMELLEGDDLRHRLTAQEANLAAPWLPDAETQRIAREVLAGLYAAHEAGVVHRDLKPDNIFLSTNGGVARAKIVDFGLSKLSGGTDEMRLTRTGQIMGTPLYMAPEQTRGSAGIDHRADLYAMGVILYELVTGRLPFEAQTIYDLIVKHATEQPPGPRTHRPDLPEAVEAVIMRCLEKKPDARFQSARELLEAWEGAWSGTFPTEAPAAAGTSGTAQAVALPGPAVGVGASSGPALESSPDAGRGSRPEVSSSAGPSAAPVGQPRGKLWAGVAALAVLAGVGGVVWATIGGSGSEQAPAPTSAIAPPAAEPPPAPHVQPVPDAPARPPQTVAASADVRRIVASSPPGATIERGGTTLGTAPVEVVLVGGASVEVTLRAAGRRPVTRVITASDPPTVTVGLEHAARRSDPALPTLAPR